MSKKVNESNYLFKIKSEIDSYEYKMMTKYFPSLFWRIIFYKANVYEIINFEFYDNYFIKEEKSASLKIDYSEVEKIIETDKNFYLRSSKENDVIIIQKNECDLELVNFIREKFENLENRLGEDSNFKGVKFYHSTNFIKYGMFILFILTIMSMHFALISSAYIDTQPSISNLSFNDNMWVCWCWLPIPIASIVLGFKYKRAGFKCKKNIIAGFIFGYLLLMAGFISLNNDSSVDYNLINPYKNVIDAKLPSTGKLYIDESNNFFDQDKREYFVIDVYYTQDEVEDLIASIESSENWFLSTEIKSSLKIFIPKIVFSNDDDYFSIYNKTTNEYNKLPEEAGNYEIYTMRYDKSNRHLQIHKFMYEYN